MKLGGSIFRYSYACKGNSGSRPTWKFPAGTELPGCEFPAGGELPSHRNPLRAAAIAPRDGRLHVRALRKAPSTASAEGKPSLFGRFIGIIPSSDFWSSAKMQHLLVLCCSGLCRVLHCGRASAARPSSIAKFRDSRLGHPDPIVSNSTRSSSKDH